VITVATTSVNNVGQNRVMGQYLLELEFLQLRLEFGKDVWIDV
jgi:hypothetical protein